MKYENQFFSYEECDYEPIKSSYTNVVLTKQLGTIPAGTYFPLAYVDYEAGEIEFVSNDMLKNLLSSISIIQLNKLCDIGPVV